jgi:hypothetical protein
MKATEMEDNSEAKPLAQIERRSDSEVGWISRFAIVLANRVKKLAYPESLRGEAQIVLGPLIVVSLTDTSPFRIGPRTPPLPRGAVHHRSAPNQSTVTFLVLGLRPKRRPRDSPRAPREGAGLYSNLPYRTAHFVLDLIVHFPHD